MGNDEIDESLPIVFHSRLPGFPVCYRQAAFYSNAQFIVSLTQERSMSRQKVSTMFCYSFLRSLALTV